MRKIAISMILLLCLSVVLAGCGEKAGQAPKALARDATPLEEKVVEPVDATKDAVAIKKVAPTKEPDRAVLEPVCPDGSAPAADGTCV